MNTLNQNLTQFFWNTDFNMLDITTSSNVNQFSVSDYIFALLLHNAFKSFDGGETFTGSVINEFTTTGSIQFQGNLRAVMQNKSIGEEQNEAIIDEVRTCLKTGVDEGIFTLPSENDVSVSSKGNIYYITINIIVNKRRQELVFYYNNDVSEVRLVKK
jgi:hypothetical protein